ncbi:MAG TPA: ribosomal protein S18-alanine N-acetyltransferase [Thermoclostridium caenicola]|uniref:ribosomal protein S18-alanine N-acetyltransferase n=1 Tax=Thermoclostridium caenicola TaxID=659425 RepID=UPI002CE3B2F8|nr:ribosomal protein S18-alanine N-acetyltransferase [Thermoclostridium caenicola]HOK43766.1 ribosomal protein S18-alanine N-acetyltransferase [Thermoclostridium caenicola]HOL83963.1 ribosomal protein S18-alanine N-acetyltransferase [Thermoclostridium caenicola]HOP72071.1 ribosomal protein S18-alanine N-acetyltransferase [Thermoclostridium caenicola]HPO75549.1 ribosomal protein S18-alanine N-acetyltransferase [Thermoclostridium caenicola]HPU21560.1 ribosomal protein S18-alanine N-acetyltransfe
MSDQILIRDMRESDLDAMAAIEQASFSVPWTRNMLEEELSNSRARYRVLEFQGAVVGYIGMWQILDEGHITNVAVLPEFRRRGFARRLMQDLVDYAKANGIRSLTLEVRVGNLPAIRLYESFGFQIEGRRKHYYADNNEDALIMWLRLE